MGVRMDKTKKSFVMIVLDQSCTAGIRRRPPETSLAGCLDDMPISSQCAGKAMETAGISPNEVRTSCLKRAYHRMVVLHMHCATVCCSKQGRVTSSEFIAKPPVEAPIRICLHATALPGQCNCA